MANTIDTASLQRLIDRWREEEKPDDDDYGQGYIVGITTAADDLAGLLARA